MNKILQGTVDEISIGRTSGNQAQGGTITFEFIRINGERHRTITTDDYVQTALKKECGSGKRVELVLYRSLPILRWVIVAIKDSSGELSRIRNIQPAQVQVKIIATLFGMIGFLAGVAHGILGKSIIAFFVWAIAVPLISAPFTSIGMMRARNALGKKE